ncbi:MULTISPECIES: hypothetical protein [Niallia]|uniref:Uncharacterized protein n=1 Tax=Niallia taxi TaxID=2499688 RepID=A0A437K751_9BACI|nr:hypothetical protein [Niallia taxi]MDK8642994.1 hypothetical protein [Niallia taxi]MED4038254.1 hypothetical protein [Niallia taxi]MED4055147.1 hypothetical protein [Niallia taxi]MED4120663.1 hypothetical protein [Niallia taxi]RVT59412.1 hypothetical protein EM808_19105 [Niallia taxi]
MKRLDWIIALFLVVIGLTCLTMSATWMMDTGSIRSYFTNFLQICLWIGIPILIVGVIYYVMKRKRRDS